MSARCHKWQGTGCRAAVPLRKTLDLKYNDIGFLPRGGTSTRPTWTRPTASRKRKLAAVRKIVVAQSAVALRVRPEGRSQGGGSAVTKTLRTKIERLSFAARSRRKIGHFRDFSKPVRPVHRTL